MTEIQQRYITLLKHVLTDYHRMELGEYKLVERSNATWKTKLLLLIDSILSTKGFAVCRRILPNKENRLNGLDWPSNADTMIGVKRMDNIEYCVKTVVAENIEGDLIETGVWRGGATIFMKALLSALGDTKRNVWVADSFAGLPKPNKEKYKADEFDEHYKVTELAIALETVKYNFQKYDLLDERVKFLKGWFKDTLPSAPIKSLSVLRLDGDMYESTMDGLRNLYPKLTSGGFIIIDDYEAVNGCKQAVLDYRAEQSITETITVIDRSAVYWRKK